MGQGEAVGSQHPSKIRDWSFWPRIHADVFAVDHSLRFFWLRHVPLLVSFTLFTLLPFVRQWTGLSPKLSALALFVHALVFGSEAHLRISRAIGLTGYTTLVLTTNFLVVMAICASPGRFVPIVWPLYFIYLVIPSTGASRSVYVAMVAMISPFIAGSAWDALGTSIWKDSAILLGIVSVFAGFGYILLSNYNTKLRRERVLLEQTRLHRARQEQKLAIADDLHDTLGIALAEATLWQNIGKSAAGEDGRAALDRAEQRLQDAIHELRAAVATLSDRDVPQATIQQILRARIESLCQAANVAPEIHFEGASSPLESNRAHHVIKLAEEAASNAIRHGNPTRLSVRLSLEDGIHLVVKDDGNGFDPSTVREGHGLSSLRRRGEVLGGTLDIQSGIGEGTTIDLRIP